MCDKIFNTHPSTVQFFPEYFKTQEACDKIVKNCYLFEVFPKIHLC